MKERILAHFQQQAGFCTEYGSPFTGALIEAMARDLEQGGPVAALVSDWSTNPAADALALRLAGALHEAVLTGRDQALAALYAAGDANAAWPAARTLFARDRDAVRAFIQSPPQTNETRRSIALLAAFLAFAERWRGPIDTLEIGASAGLNLNWDRFAYQTPSWRWGEGAVRIDTDWHGPPPAIDARPSVRHRAACDLNPLDIRDEAQRLRLKSYVWPDQPDRLARFDAAVALAVASGVRVERADAAEWLARKLADRAADAATIVYHSVFLQYPPKDTRAAIIAAVTEAGKRATAAAPLAWVRMEPEAVLDGVQNGFRFIIDLTTWPGGERRILGYTDGHVRAVYAEPAR